MKATILSSARADILRQVRYFADLGQPQVGARFLHSVQSAVEDLLATPNAGSPKHLDNPRLAGLRTWAIDGFEDIKIYYIASAGSATIVRVLHGRRDIGRILGG